MLAVNTACRQHCGSYKLALQAPMSMGACMAPTLRTTVPTATCSAGLPWRLRGSHCQRCTPRRYGSTWVLNTTWSAPLTPRIFPAHQVSTCALAYGSVHTASRLQFSAMLRPSVSLHIAAEPKQTMVCIATSAGACRWLFGNASRPGTLCADDAQQGRDYGQASCA